jgi:hypothetical protein
MAKSTVRDFLPYLYEHNKTELEYHDHKETLGWAAVAAYLAASVALAVNSQPGSSELAHAGEQVGVLLSLILFVSYARRQFNNREWAARVTQALSELMVEALDADLDSPISRLAPKSRRASVASPSQPEERASSGGNSCWLSRWAAEARDFVFPSRIQAEGRTDLHPIVIGRIEKPDVSKGPLSLELSAYSVMCVAAVVLSAATWG